MSATDGYTSIPLYPPGEAGASASANTHSHGRRSSITRAPSLRSTSASHWLKALAFCAVVLLGVNLLFRPRQPLAPAEVEEAASDTSLMDILLGSRPGTPHRVGPRQFSGLYGGCSSSALRDALAAAQLRKDGQSNTQLNSTSNDSTPLARFKFSYHLQDCPAPHVFSPSEACDLLNAFGGVFLRGDSSLRHVSQGLFALVSNSFDILWSNKPAQCEGTAVFDDDACRFAAKFDARELDLAKEFCASGEIAPVRYEQLESWEPEPHPTQDHPVQPHSELDEEAQTKPSVAELSAALQRTYASFVGSLGAKRQALSPVYIHGTGPNHRWDLDSCWDYVIQPFLRAADLAHPRPITLWSLAPFPKANKSKQLPPAQKPEEIRKFNEGMIEMLKGASRGERDAARGAWAAMDWSGATESAMSFDATQRSYQIAIERAQILLNYLDVLWGEIVDLGGLVEG